MSAKRWRGLSPALFMVALTILAAHYTRVRQFGLYEDDYWSIAPHLDEPLGHLWTTLVSDFTQWPTGRPLNYFLPVALSTTGSAIGGLVGVYALAAAWLTANGLLVFVIVRRLASGEAALVAALAYVVFPADSTKILLVHASHVQGAMTFLLLGLWLWLRGSHSRPFGYPVAALALLSYESAFLPFLAAPLLSPDNPRTRVRTWAIHLGACAAIVGIDAWIRLSTGDARAAGAVHRAGESLYRSATSLFIGPFTSGKALFAAVVTGWRRLDLTAAVAAALVVAAFAVVVGIARSRGAPSGEDASDVLDGPRRERVSWRWLLGAAVLTWAVSYALTLVNYPPAQKVGRLTSAHVAAGWPVALAIAALYEGGLPRLHARKTIAAAVFAAWLGSMVLYHQYLQRGYVRAWDMQRVFWKQVMLLAPEAGPGWAVIVAGTPAEGTPVIFSNAWSDYHVLRLIFTTCEDVTAPAFGHLGSMGRDIPFRRSGDRVEWKPRFWDGQFEAVEPTRLVLLSDDRGVLRRVAQITTDVGNLEASAVPPPSARPQWPPTPVSKLLFPERVH